MLKHPTKLKISKSEGRGWGVFASEEIKSGEVLEECVVYKVPLAGNDDYSFQYKRGSMLKKQKRLSSGFGCMYNHSNDPNVEYLYHQTLEDVFVFKAKKDISIGEELYIYYGDGKYWSSRPHVKVV